MLAKGPFHMADKLVNLIALSCTKKRNNYQGAIKLKCGSENNLSTDTRNFTITSIGQGNDYYM